MNLPNDIATINRLSTPQRGCFSKHDIQTALNEPHASALVRRINALQAHRILRRVTRGWYVTADFDPAVLSQRIAPASYLSLESVLGAEGVVGVRPERRVVAVKTGKARTYESDGISIEHLAVQPALEFGWHLDGVVRRATPEKALLDALYFYQHGTSIALRSVFRRAHRSHRSRAPECISPPLSKPKVYRIRRESSFVMTAPIQRPATREGLLVWVLHRFAEEFGEQAILKGALCRNIARSH
jgi:hypothetical protein